MRKRTALVLTGLARDFNLAAEHIHRNIIQPFSIAPTDVYIDIWSDKGYWYPGDALVKKSFLETGLLSHTEVNTYYPESHINIEDFANLESTFLKRLESFPEEFRKDLNHSNFFVRGINLVSMFYKINKGINLVKDKNFDLVIRTRPDIYLPKKLRLFSTGKMRILKQRNHFGGGLGDNLHLGSLENISTLGEIYNNLEEVFILTNQILCPYLFIKEWLAIKSIKHKEFSMRGWSTLHTPGGQYKALNAEGAWDLLGNGSYERNKDRFDGSVS